ncbi:MAG: hypothetical protein PHG16_02710, partial [Lachnospiraceae bacterium]|nr:hypothetical protein [Lachnospiraceae bacterium]
KGKIDNLIGLKENVLIGKLIPAGTGMKCYSNVKLDTDGQEEEQILDFDDEELELDEEMSDNLEEIAADEAPEDTEEVIIEEELEEAVEEELEEEAPEEE